MRKASVQEHHWIWTSSALSNEGRLDRSFKTSMSAKENNVADSKSRGPRSHTLRTDHRNDRARERPRSLKHVTEGDYCPPVIRSGASHTLRGKPRHISLLIGTSLSATKCRRWPIQSEKIGRRVLDQRAVASRGGLSLGEVDCPWDSRR